MALTPDSKTDHNTERRMHDIRYLAHQHAQAKGNRVRLEHYRKIKLAELMKTAERQGFKAVNQQEREAYSSPEYLQVIDGLAEATRQESEHYWLLLLEQWKFEAWRTEQANQRAEFKQYGN